MFEIVSRARTMPYFVATDIHALLKKCNLNVQHEGVSMACSTTLKQDQTGTR